MSAIAKQKQVVLSLDFIAVFLPPHSNGVFILLQMITAEYFFTPNVKRIANRESQPTQQFSVIFILDIIARVQSLDFSS